MNKRKAVTLTLVLSFFAFFLYPSSTYAHTKLVQSIPEVGQSVSKSFEELTLQFNTNIEMLSTFTLWDEKGAEVDLGSTEIRDKTLSRKISTPTELNNGTYTVAWKIVGKDGHPIEGEYTFQVDILKSSNQVETGSTMVKPSTEQQSSVSSAASSEKSTTETPAASATVQSAEKSTETRQNGIPIGIGITMLLMITWIGIRVAKRRKS